MRPRVLLADDHAIVAKTLGRLIEEVADLLGTVSDGGQLIDRARLVRPEIIVADVHMPVVSGLDAMRQLRAEGVHAKFIFVTVHADARIAAEALDAGASGFVFKQAAGEELIEAIQAVAEGGTYLTAAILRS